MPGPGDARFPATAWTVIQGAQDADDAECSRALGRLLGVYWRPVYWTLRSDWRASPEEARDLTQEYFSVFLEKEMVRDVERERGRFRAYVKATIRNFMLNRRRGEGALKRGGGEHLVSLDELERAEAEGGVVDESAEHRFERELVRSIIRRSLDDLEAACVREAKPGHFALFQAYYLEEAAGRPVRYEDLVVRFGCGPHDVKNRLAEMRTRFRKIVLSFLRDGISTEQELVSEIREVFDR